MQNELRECPFCGKRVAVCETVADINCMDDDSSDYDWAIGHYAVVCNFNKGGCGACTGLNFQTREKAIQAWNRRIYREN